MQIITYNEALTQLCDWFDSTISPRTIERSNANIIYLILKAFAKGWEIINNLCTVTSSKFDPVNCSDSDLESVAYLVGTKKEEGSVSGLLVTVTNNSNLSSAVLPSGTYIYALDADTQFKCTLSYPITVSAGASEQVTFLSKEKGSFHVTAQTDISIIGTDENDSDINIPSDLSFSNSDNASLLGHEDETNLEFRKRILSDTSRQDAISELRLKLRNLPYVFDCEIVFNQDLSGITVGSYTVPPYYMLIMLSTAMYTEEIAKIIAESAVYPTVNVQNVSHEVDYYSDVFASGKYAVYVNDFDHKDFTATVTYRTNASYVSGGSTEKAMREALYTAINKNVHKDTITADELFSVLESLDLEGVSLLGVQLYVDSSPVIYVSCLKTEIARLTLVNFSNVQS